MFHRRVNQTTIKEKNMLPIGSIFFYLKVARMRIVNNLKGYSVEKPFEW